jgi:hypothetical protein
METNMAVYNLFHKNQSKKVIEEKVQAITL